MKFLIYIWIGLIFSLGFSCGYHLLSREAHLPGGVSKIYVEPARNQTMELGLEQIFTQKLLERLGTDKRIQIVREQEADAILRSELLHLFEQTLAVDKFGRVILQKIELSVRVSLISVKDHQKIWDSGVLRQREQYPVSDDFLRNDQLRRFALGQMSERLSRTVLELLTGDF